MQIRGREVDFKIGRLKDAAAFEKALDNMGKAEKEIKKKSSLAQIISGEIDMFRVFIKEATGEDVLEDCDDLEEPQTTMDSRLRLAKRNADMRAYVKKRMEECQNG